MEVNDSRRQNSPWFWGGGGVLILLAIFYLVQALGMQSLVAPFAFMKEKWFLVSPLAIGFGIQAGLFRAMHLLAHRGGGATLVASGGVSSGSMFACCLHNLVPLFPVLGLTGLAAFFAAYQTQVFLISIAMTAFGAGLMIKKYLKLSSDVQRSRRVHPFCDDNANDEPKSADEITA
ncbi:hypothetical protein HZA85_03930 [Candidatus Uhrbacteria bacterium]|nr:hypothetical protein [Candidatus Uhrbacteria bacterium]